MTVKKTQKRHGYKFSAQDIKFYPYFNLCVLSYTGKFLRGQIFADWPKIRCEPYKLFDLCV